MKNVFRMLLNYRLLLIEHHLLTGHHHLDVPGGHAQSECFAKLLFYNLQL